MLYYTQSKARWLQTLSDNESSWSLFLISTFTQSNIFVSKNNWYQDVSNIISKRSSESIIKQISWSCQDALLLRHPKQEARVLNRILFLIISVIVERRVPRESVIIIVSGSQTRKSIFIPIISLRSKLTELLTNNPLWSLNLSDF